MIDYGRFKLSFAEAKARVDILDNMTDVEFRDQIRYWSLFDVPNENYAPIYEAFRTELVEEFKRVLNSNNFRVDYTLDLCMGIKLYELLNAATGFSLVMANNDDIWRYITLCVMPDLTFIRYPNIDSDVDAIKEHLPNLSYAIGIKTEKDSVRIKKKRFYSHTRRIWLKTLWWYVYLGWQGTSEKTYDVLKNNGTNIISHFIERPGRGYRTRLFRYMLLSFSLLPEQKDKTFRAAAKLNLAKCVSVEPELTDGSEERYASLLFEEVV